MLPAPAWNVTQTAAVVNQKVPLQVRGWTLDDDLRRYGYQLTDPSARV